MHVVQRFDAIVVGAGPGGSVAAYHLARGGASVLLLDRARFPRDKPCGGGLTGRALRQLPFSVDPVVEDVVDCFELRLRYGRSHDRRGREPLALMTQRRRLDAYLAERAAEAGADFRDGCRVSTVETDDGHATVAVDGQRLQADIVIGADGVNGVTTRAYGPRYVYGVALEGNASYDDVAPERYRGRAVLELGIVPGGYGWVFAKAQHVNIGVGGWEHQGPRLRPLLARLCAEHGVSVDRLTDVRGFRLPLRRPSDVPAAGRVALIGDAAGLVDPMSGDGMYEAFLSARLAAETGLDVLGERSSSFEPYVMRLRRAVELDAKASLAAKHSFDRYPRLTFALMASPPVWAFMDRLLRGEIRHVRDAHGIARVPLRLIERIGSSKRGAGYTSAPEAA
jgi:geranylgeranyl reductase family protein